MRFLDHLLGRRVACAQCQTVTRNSYGLCEACIEERLHGTRRQASPRTLQAVLRITMTTLMRSLTLLCLSAIAMLCLYVPWRVSYSGEAAVLGSRDLGYGFLWNPPEAQSIVPSLPGLLGTVTVDLTRVTLSLLGGAAILTLVLLLGWWMGAWRRGRGAGASVTSL